MTMYHQPDPETGYYDPDEGFDAEDAQRETERSRLDRRKSVPSGNSKERIWTDTRKRDTSKNSKPVTAAISTRGR